ncbi:hypothetical protein TCELL_1299 [Thermogladius calderae 1633]|uniref:Flippase-like domain-containing protein n=1 Tax=Thermogladius calderae (strain DSM 22663 / VKM B-2946 / 1633) TaxID=1184251 RepID=I3TG34_THEC1|nr:lysylphosphatidylglycerol synthase domain-containing protein [Thermogladius calderae]AFK51722.1 hypothetical protein TCELL_1299 [Thermogladius calderae 1633]
MKVGVDVKKWAVSVVVVFATILAYSVVTSSYTAVFKTPLINLALASAILMFGYFVSSVRLMIIHSRYTGTRLGVSEYYKARLMGNLVGFLTPSAVGGEIGRAGYLSSKGFPFTDMVAVSYYEVFFDVVFCNIMGIVFSVNQFPWTLPVLVVASFTLATWVAISAVLLYAGGRQISNSRTILGWRGLGERVLQVATNIARAFKSVSRRVGAVDLAYIVLLTTASQVLQAASLLAITGVYAAKGLVVSMSAYFYSQSLSSIPTPGGAVTSEYGLSLVLEPEAVVSFRLVYALANIVPGLIIMLKAYTGKRGRV